MFPQRPTMGETLGMTEQEVFVLADRALDVVVQQIDDDQWQMPMPPSFARRGSDEAPTLRTIIGYHAFDDAWVPDMLAGKTMEDAGTGKFDGDLLGDDPKGEFAAIVAVACAAAEQHEDLDKIVHCSFGDYPARHYFWQITQFRALRAHDLSLLIGIESDLPDDLVEGVWEQLVPVAEEWREIGIFKEEIPVPKDAALIDRLLGLTGRKPAPS